jgi:hypothetical protein
MASVIKYFDPQKSCTIEEMDSISAKVPGKWTWPTAAMLWMIENGYEIRLIEDFDYALFAEKGKDYIIDKCGKEVGEAQIKNSIIDREQELARKFAKFNLVERRLPVFEDIEILLNGGYLIICNINAAALNRQKGYSGHFVVVYKFSRKTITIHDPGLPPRPSLEVPLELFEKAWAYPSESEKNLLAIRKRSL